MGIDYYKKEKPSRNPGTLLTSLLGSPCQSRQKKKQFISMTPIMLILSLLLSSVAATPVAEPWDNKHHYPWKPQDQGCPANGTLSGNYFSVEGLVPVSSSQPTVAFSFSNSAIVTPNEYCTVFNLIIPPSGVGKTCTLEFLLPDMYQAGYNYTFAGPGHFTFTG